MEGPIITVSLTTITMSFVGLPSYSSKKRQATYKNDWIEGFKVGVEERRNVLLVWLATLL